MLSNADLWFLIGVILGVLLGGAIVWVNLHD